jgi:hypothetical protein
MLAAGLAGERSASCCIETPPLGKVELDPDLRFVA